MAAASASSQGGGEASVGAEANGGEGAAEGGVGAGGGPRLVIYSRDGCCLCDGLKEKIETALLMGTESSVLDGLQVEVRDITTRKEWMEAYQYEIPVMMRVTVDQSGNSIETLIPRQSPRASVDRVRKALEAAFST
ncbi:hypothetical protein CLOM_g9798 [Closterium sp. NIES-68]|nr:hypothetical protein CLOM_g9798 [Closterium sp. NIES-68]